MEVVVNIYDVTNTGSEKTNYTILHINRIFKDAIGLGGIFHSAIQVYGDEEWSFGFCDYGSGVFSCPPRRNPMYSFRESLVIGKTSCSTSMVKQILKELSREWPGRSYDLLSRNCNHFCDAFCERLDLPKLPGWVNRFANAGDTAIEVAENAATKLEQAKTEILNAGKVAYRFISGAASSTSTPESPRASISSAPFFQGTWFTNLINVGAKPSSSKESPEGSEDDKDTSDDEHPRAEKSEETNATE